MTLRERDEDLLRAAPKSVPQLVEFLTEYLHWPLPADMEPEDVALIDWSLDDLHLDSDQVARLNRVSQLPKFVDTQPFGVFVLEFDNGRLPVGAIRRVVNKLVAKKRTQANVAHQQWNLEDLLFFCQSNQGHAELHVVAFRETDGKSAMKVMSWSSESTDNRLEVIATHNLSKLSWPASAAKDAVLTLRDSLLEAFTAEYRQGVKSADLLAKKMAEVARFVREEVLTLYQVETDDGPLRELFTEVRARLDQDMSPGKFADMYSQTMVYGLLTARITHPEDFVPGQVMQVLRFENPFLDALYARFRRGGDETVDVDEFGLGDLASLLAETDVDELLADFGTGEHRDDPVVFFYEEFLLEYDPQQKKELGTYYTPIPVVRFMTRAVDSIIKRDFGLPLGVADTTTWREYSADTGQPVPEGRGPEDRVITVLDPATGTGTFVLEWLRLAFSNLEAIGQSAPETRARVVKSLDAFEISLSSYSVAELKVNLELDKETRSLATPNIRLTDSLEGERLSAIYGDDPLAEEGRLALEAKFDKHHSVVIGNPPYLRAKGGESGGWLTNPTQGGRPIFEDVHEPARANTIFSHQASLFNLYVYFWRFGLWKAFEQNTSGPAVAAFISANSWLRGPGFMGLRQLSRTLADDIYVIDLGGDGYGAQQGHDENIFPIQTPVSIVLVVRSPQSRSDTAGGVHFLRVQGTKNEKLALLADLDLTTIEFEDGPTAALSAFAPPTGGMDWQDYPALVDLLPWQSPGCKWNRTWPVAPSKESLEKRWRRLVASESLEDRKLCFAQAETGRGVETDVANLPRIQKLGPDSPYLQISPYGYRSFDRQSALADPRLSSGMRPVLWGSSGDNQIFLVSRPTAILGSGPAATVSVAVPDLHYFMGSGGGKDVFPKFRDAAGTPNVEPHVLEAIRIRLGAEQTSDFWDEVFCYIYGLLAGTSYSQKFAQALATPGPRIPLSADPHLFEKMSSLGRRLLFLQTYGERCGSENGEKFTPAASIKWSVEPIVGPREMKEIAYDSATLGLKIGDGLLQGVTPEAWSFSVSGMPIMKKWLGYRTHKGSGRAASSNSPLDKIRPDTWEPEWSSELRDLVHLLTESSAMLAEGDELLDLIIAGELISANELPEIGPEWRKAPPSSEWWLETHTLF